MANYIANHWYVAARTTELGDSLFARTLLDIPVILFRRLDGTVACLLDQCPHKLAPLSLGEYQQGNVQCGYHGLLFDGSGNCIKAPGQSRIPPKACVRNFPAVERYGFVFVWMGDPAQADERALPQLDRYGREGWGLLADGYQLHKSNYLNIVENLMDPSHTTFVHKQTIANPLAEDEPVEVELKDDHLVAYKWIENTEPSPQDRRSYSGTSEVVDRGQFFYFFPPSVSMVDICVMDAGQEHTDENMDKGARTLSYKFLTPETETSTHLFYLHLRNYRLGDPEFEQMLRTALEKTFWEDNDICAAVQREQKRTGLRQITFLDIDKGPRLAVQMIQRRISMESGSGSKAI